MSPATAESPPVVPAAPAATTPPAQTGSTPVVLTTDRLAELAARIRLR